MLRRHRSLCLALVASASLAAPAAAVTMISATPPPPARQPAPRPAPTAKQAISGVPEPGLWVLIGSGLAMAGAVVRRRPSTRVVTS